MAKKKNSEQSELLDQLNGASEVETTLDVANETKERELTAAEQFYLESHRNSTDDEIAEVLDADVSFIANKRMELQVTFEKKQPSVVDLSYNQDLRRWEDKEGNVYNGPDVNVDDVKETVEIKKQVTAGIKAGDLIGRNESKTATVMTGGASQMSDIIKGAKQRLIPSCVHQPKKAR